jgi:hypothetical protein
VIIELLLCDENRSYYDGISIIIEVFMKQIKRMGYIYLKEIFGIEFQRISNLRKRKMMIELVIFGIN